MRKSMLSLLVVVMLGTASAADAPISLPANVKTLPGIEVVLTAETTAKLVRWVPLTDGCRVIPHADPENPTGRSALFIAANAGTYRVLAYTSINDVPTLPCYCTVTVGDKPPPPPPDDPVDDTRIKGGSFVVCRETSTQTPALGKMLADAAMRAELKTLGFDFWTLDPNEASYVEGYKKYADKVGLPCVVVVSTDNKIVKPFPLPKSAAEFVSFAKRLTGEK